MFIHTTLPELDAEQPHAVVYDHRDGQLGRPVATFDNALDAEDLAQAINRALVGAHLYAHPPQLPMVKWMHEKLDQDAVAELERRATEAEAEKVVQLRAQLAASALQGILARTYGSREYTAYDLAGHALHYADRLLAKMESTPFIETPGDARPTTPNP